MYPKLSKMVFDYLSIPATSTAVEHIFSQGRQLLHFTRNCLSPASIHAIMFLGRWPRKDLVAAEDIVRSLKARGKVDEGKESDDED
ncbi:hypothetical protein H0H92_015589 [Tricholoma furcatifolium]|nr:hypothetical protein H0H92_015589 [Tricholoma furcatifolium]